MTLLHPPKYPIYWYKLMMAVMVISLSRFIIPLYTFSPTFHLHHIINLLMLILAILIFRQVNFQSAGQIIGNIGLMSIALAGVMKLLHLQGADILFIIGFCVLSGYFAFRFYQARSYTVRNISFFLFSVPILIATCLRMLHLTPEINYSLFVLSELAGLVFLYGEYKAVKVPQA